MLHGPCQICSVPGRGRWRAPATNEVAVKVQISLEEGWNQPSDLYFVALGITIVVSIMCVACLPGGHMILTRLRRKNGDVAEDWASMRDNPKRDEISSATTSSQTVTIEWL